MATTNLVNLSEGTLAPLSARAIYFNMPPKISGRNIKKLSSLFCNELIQQFYHSVSLGKNKKEEKLSTYLKEDTTPSIVGKGLKKAKKHGNKHKAHRHVSVSTIRRNYKKNEKMNGGLGKLIKDKFRKSKRVSISPTTRHGSTPRKLAKKLSKARRQSISTTPVSKQNVSGKKVNKKMDKVKKSSSSGSVKRRRVSKPRKVVRPRRRPVTKKVPPRIVAKIIQDVRKKTGKTPSESTVKKLVHFNIKRLTQPGLIRHRRRPLSKSDKIIQKIVNQNLNKPRFAIKLLKRDPNDKEKAIRRTYDSIARFALGVHTKNTIKDASHKPPTKKINNLNPPPKSWWQEVL